ncbi:MAG: hypothetical protein Q7T44_08075 [Parvibaculum sp.]|nr:hypothetical protein [Parvibaculum sp.]
MIGVHLLNLTKPPFKVIAHQSAESAATDMLLTFSAIRTLPDKVSRSFEAVARCTGVSARTPLIVAGRRLSKAMDNGVGAGQGNAYHNAQHFCEVMLGAYFLSLLSDLDTKSRLEVVLAALVHDFQHDGKGNGHIPFRLERIAVDKSTPYLVAARVPELQRGHVAALVLATEMGSGLAITHASHAHHVGGTARPEVHGSAPELAGLATNFTLARQALIVCEADVLPSVGLTVEHSLRLQDGLATEWGVTLGAQDKFRFIAETFPGLIMGVFFQPNVERLRQFLLQRTKNAAAA